MALSPDTLAVTSVAGEEGEDREREGTMRKVIYNLSDLNNIEPAILPRLYLQSLEHIYLYQELTIREALKEHNNEILQDTRKLLIQEFYKVFPSHQNKVAISRRTVENVVGDIYYLGKSIYYKDICNEATKLFKNGNALVQTDSKDTSQEDKDTIIDTLKESIDELIARQKSQDEAYTLLVSQHLSLVNEHFLLVRQLQDLNLLNKSNGSVPPTPSQTTSPPSQHSNPPFLPTQTLSSVTPSAPPETPTHTPIPSAPPYPTTEEEPVLNLHFFGNIDEECDSDSENKEEVQVDSNTVGEVAINENSIVNANQENGQNIAEGESYNQENLQAPVATSKKKKKKKIQSTLKGQPARKEVAKLYIAGGLPDSNVEQVFKVLNQIGIVRQRCTVAVHKRTEHETSFQVTVPEGLVDSVFKHTWPKGVFVRPFREQHERRKETRKPLTGRSTPRYKQTWNRRHSGPPNTWNQRGNGPAKTWNQQGRGPVGQWNQRDSGPFNPWNRDSRQSYTWNQQSSGPFDSWNQRDGRPFNTWNQFGAYYY